MTGNAPAFDDGFRAQLEALFRWRRDVRHFRTDPLPPGALQELLELVELTPSVGLSQAWHVVVVDDPGRRAAVQDSFEACNAAALAAQDGARGASYARLKLAGLQLAPCQLAVFADPEPTQGHGLGRATMPETATFGAVMAIHTLWLAARAAGLGLGWVSILDPGVVARALEVPAGWRLVGYVCLGFPVGEDDTPLLERAGWERRRTGGAVLRR